MFIIKLPPSLLGEGGKGDEAGRVGKMNRLIE
jgi:hypothetical protein